MYWKIASYAVPIILAGIIGWQTNGWRLEARIASLKENYSRVLAQAYQAAIEREKRLINDSEKVKEEKDAQIRNIRTRLGNALGELHNRPDRLPEAPSTCRGTSGAELARGNAEFLVQFAADAAEVEAKLNYCINQYNSARKMLE